MTSTTLPRSAPSPAGPPPPKRSPLIGQATRFLLVGGFATLVDVGLFNLLHYGLSGAEVLGLAVVVGPLTAKVLSTIVAGVVAFVGNRQWSFAGASGDLRQQALLFVAVNAAALLLALAPLAATRYVLGLTGFVALNLAGNVVGLATGHRVPLLGLPPMGLPGRARFAGADPDAPGHRRLTAPPLTGR